MATFLGAANLVLAQHTARGICIGADPVMALGSRAASGGRDHEVVAVLRPEDIEIAPSREELHASFLGLGTVEQQLFVGANERLRVRLNNAARCRPCRDRRRTAMPPKPCWKSRAPSTTGATTRWPPDKP